MELQLQLDPNPYFRKAITPWYDSNLACWMLVVFMALVFVFAAAGIYVGSTVGRFNAHVWFPCLLAALSMFLIIKVLLRLQKRSKNN